MNEDSPNEEKARRPYPALRVVTTGSDSSESSSSIVRPVTPANRRKFLPEGVVSPLIHSQTVGCVTPTRAPSPAWEVPVSSSQRLRRTMDVNIGKSYGIAIGRSYGDLKDTHAMRKAKPIETVVDRALRAGKLKFNRRVTLAEIGKWAGNVKQPSVSEWRQPGRNPSMENVKLLATHLGVSVEWLLTGHGEMYAGPPPDEALMRLLDYWPFLDDITKGELLGIAHQVARENQAFVADRRDRTVNPHGE